jgi:2-polyprenyl-6-methoxyphenol hydroxylase-like FAD-dependent oxidoreductase
MGPERVVIAGGGIGGLATALAAARTGHEVTLLERDEVASCATADEAFMVERRGAPQAHQTHGFLARVVVVLRERFPDVLDALLRAGCSTMSGVATLGEPQPGDEDLAVLIVRRTTFEWVLRCATLAEPRVTTCTANVAGVHFADAGGTPVVDGVVLDDGTVVPADVVVASTGRRGDVPAWLATGGVAVKETVHESGLMYLSRWYRLPADAPLELDPKLGGDLGFVKYLGVPGDGGTLSVTLAIRADDAPLRAALSDADRFDIACRTLPGPDRFFRNGPLDALTPVKPMAGLLNRIRRFADRDGEPYVLGFHAVGDAHTCTNPLYGRGCSLAMVQGVLLADAMNDHPHDAVARARAYESACRREIEPWWELAVQMDKLGADPAGFSGAATGAGGNDQMKAMGAVFAAAATDPVIGRAMARFWNLLATPSDLMADGELLARVAAVMADPDAHPLPKSDGPSRDALLEALAA